MKKTFSRTHIDLLMGEVIWTLMRLANPWQARRNSNVTRFEEAFAAYVGTNYAVAFPYCRTAMYYALTALNLKPDDEVILPAYTFWVDAAMVIMAGLKPVFVDVDFHTANIDPAKIEAAVTSRTKVIFPTHLNGLPAEMEPIVSIAKRHKLRVMEDCARSCGAVYKHKKVGSFDIGTFSFGLGKSFYDFEGGMITSNDAAFIERVKDLKKEFHSISFKNLMVQIVKGNMLRFLNNPYLYTYTLYPLICKYVLEGNEKYASLLRVKMPAYETVPDSFRVDMHNIQAWLGMQQLKRIDETNVRRMANAELLTNELRGIDEIVLPPLCDDRTHVSVHYAVWSEQSRTLQRYLLRNHIDAKDESAVDTTTLPRFKQYVVGDFPNAQKLYAKVIILPTHPHLTKNDMLYIARKVKQFFKKHTSF
ncbi:MAG: aminotransferase class I/II-fold pyridoxal phosphate-dependent enzyme [Candidatus Omnitrophota bacterium]